LSLKAGLLAEIDVRAERCKYDRLIVVDFSA